jgi:hypothetical protein
VEERPQPANIQFTGVYERTPEKLLREWGGIGTAETGKPDEVAEVMEPRATVKKFPIN